MPETDMGEVSENDVLCGRGGAANGNEGNKKFRQLVADHRTEYLKARKLDKASIALRIVEIIRGKGGRFLKQDEEGTWVDIGAKRSRLKTSQALREGLDVRKHEAVAKTFKTGKNILIEPSDSHGLTQFEDADGEEQFNLVFSNLANRYHLNRVDKSRNEPSVIKKEQHLTKL